MNLIQTGWTIAAPAKRLDHGSAISAQESTRVLLVDLDTMPRQLIQHDLEHERDIALVEAPTDAPLAATVAEVDPHVVLIGRDDPDVAAEVLGEHPVVRLLAVVEDSRHLLLYELRPSRRRIGAFSKEHLLRALRRARAPRSNWMP